MTANRSKTLVGGISIFIIAMGFLASKNILNDEAVNYFNDSIT